MLQELFQLLGNIMQTSSETRMDIHCGIPKDCTQQFMVDEIRDIRNSTTPGLPITIQFYYYEEREKKQQCLPHDRYMMTDQFCLFIGCGMDFLNPKSKTNRAVTISIINPEECQNVIESYSSKKSGEVLKI